MTDVLDTQTQGQEQLDPNKSFVEQLVGDDKKFKDLEALAKGKFEADEYIRFKNQEFDALKQDYLTLKEQDKQRATLQEMLDQQKKMQQLASSEHQNANEEQNKPAYVTPEKADELFQNRIAQYEKQKTEEANANLVRNKLTEHYGNNYQNAVNNQIQELGLTIEEFNQRARRNPKDLFRTLGIDGPARREDFLSPPRPNVRSDNFAPSSKKRTWAYYQDLKAKSPDQYLSPQTQTQMLQDMRTLGEEFKDGNWSSL